MKNGDRKKKITGFLGTLAAVGFVVLPAISCGDNLVPCNTVENPKQCDFKDLMDLINNVIRFILFRLVVPICAIMFAYAGFLFLTSFGESAKRTKAKHIFWNVLWGLIIAVAAWLIVKVVLSLLGYDGAWIGF